jgi:hypothetical protein
MQWSVFEVLARDGQPARPLQVENSGAVVRSSSSSFCWPAAWSERGGMRTSALFGWLLLFERLASKAMAAAGGAGAAGSAAAGSAAGSAAGAAAGAAGAAAGGAGGAGSAADAAAAGG